MGFFVCKIRFLLMSWLRIFGVVYHMYIMIQHLLILFMRYYFFFCRILRNNFFNNWLVILDWVVWLKAFFLAVAEDWVARQIEVSVVSNIPFIPRAVKYRAFFFLSWDGRKPDTSSNVVKFITSINTMPFRAVMIRYLVVLSAIH